MARNKLAGKHPSYKGMSEAALKKKRAYDKSFNSRPEEVKKRVEMNRANRKAQKAGTAKIGDKRDAGHTKSGKIVQVSQSKNRSFNGRGNRPRHHA